MRQRSEWRGKIPGRFIAILKHTWPAVAVDPEAIEPTSNLAMEVPRETMAYFDLTVSPVRLAGIPRAAMGWRLADRIVISWADNAGRGITVFIVAFFAAPPPSPRSFFASTISTT